MPYCFALGKAWLACYYLLLSSVVRLSAVRHLFYDAYELVMVFWSPDVLTMLYFVKPAAELRFCFLLVSIRDRDFRATSCSRSVVFSCLSVIRQVGMQLLVGLRRENRDLRRRWNIRSILNSTASHLSWNGNNVSSCHSAVSDKYYWKLMSAKALTKKTLHAVRHHLY